MEFLLKLQILKNLSKMGETLSLSRLNITELKLFSFLIEVVKVD